MKKMFFACSLYALCTLTIFAQTSFGSVDNAEKDEEIIVDNERGFVAQIDIDTNLFQVRTQTFSDAKNRTGRVDSFLIENYPFGGFNILDDTNAAFGYNGDWYGGNLTVNKEGIDGIKAWVSFFDGKLKITAGNDIGYSYADSQGADAGLRVYDDNVRAGVAVGREPETIDSNKNPDNITQDKGILFELDLDPVKIALAGGGNIEDIAENIGSLINSSNTTGDLYPIYGHSLQYGVNIGSKIGGDIAKINGAYIFQSVKDVAKYATSASSLTASHADAHVKNHLFSAYASVYPFKNDTLGITLGYAGVLIQYLEEFSTKNSETAIPVVFKNGINLTARYQTDKLTIKTDHNYSFWTDKNYRIFNLYKTDAANMQDFGLIAKNNDKTIVSDVTHTFIWNGIGASYRFSELIEESLYIRNLIRIDETPEYRLMNDYFSLELKSTFHLGENVEAYAGITYRLSIRSASESLSINLKEFKTGIIPKAASDTSHMIQIPIGMTVKLR